MTKTEATPYENALVKPIEEPLAPQSCRRSLEQELASVPVLDDVSMDASSSPAADQALETAPRFQIVER